jgi:hypothetical protein
VPAFEKFEKAIKKSRFQVEERERRNITKGNASLRRKFARKQNAI